MTQHKGPPAYPQATWRLILDGEADGATNMAVDEAILASVREGLSPPTLRFYAWVPPCLSLGRSQPLADVDLAACRSAGVDVVRRPTGGRAILHTDELTYSAALLESDPRSEGGVLESYRRLSEGLLSGLELLGIEATQAAGSKPATDPGAVCFEVPSAYEIVAGGRKLIGSAQWRSKGGMLQHGSLPLRGDLAQIVDYLSLSTQQQQTQRPRIHARATTLAEAHGADLPFAEVSRALAEGFARALNLRLEPGELSPREHALAAKFHLNRYTAPAWTARTR